MANPRLDSATSSTILPTSSASASSPVNRSPSVAEPIALDMLTFQLEDLSSRPAPPPRTNSMSPVGFMAACSTESKDDDLYSTCPRVSSASLMSEWSFPTSKDALDSWVAFARSIPGLPLSCRLFLGWVCATVLLLYVHATGVLVEGGLLDHLVDAMCQSVSAHFYFYGISQMLLGALALRFAVSALRRENDVEITCATLLVVLTTAFDGCILFTDITGKSVVNRLDNITCGPSGGECVALQRLAQYPSFSRLTLNRARLLVSQAR